MLCVTPFEDGVSIIAFVMAGSGGKPGALYVRGGVDAVQQRLSGKAAR